MPKVFPFRALRPKADYVTMVTAKSTDFKSQEDLVHEIRINSFTFHHVTKSHLSYSGAYQEPEKFLPFASQYVKEMKEKGVLLREEEKSLYLYEQTRPDGKTFKGIIALCSIEDYKNNKIKKHEEIRPSRLKFLVELFKTTKVMGEPTLLAHNGDIHLDEVRGEELYSFTSLDEKKHKVTRISDPAEIEKIQKSLEALDSFYIADGHHRSASTETFNSQVSSLENDKSMCFIIHEAQLEILPFHRLINPVISLSEEEIIGKLNPYFVISKSEVSLYTIAEKKTYGLYINKRWYKLRLKEYSESMDVDILEELVVKNIFGIADSRTDSQISFHAYTNGESELTDLIDSGTYSVAFTSKPCTFDEVRRVSDEGKTLPPKSTYIEPKLRAGLLVQEFGVL